MFSKSHLRFVDFVMSVTRNARDAGMSRTEFVNLTKLAWDALEKEAAASGLETEELCGAPIWDEHCCKRTAGHDGVCNADEPGRKVEATNGFSIKGIWCAACGSKDGDSHLVGCPHSAVDQAVKAHVALQEHGGSLRIADDGTPYVVKEQR